VRVRCAVEFTLHTRGKSSVLLDTNNPCVLILPFRRDVGRRPGATRLCNSSRIALQSRMDTKIGAAWLHGLSSNWLLLYSFICRRLEVTPILSGAIPLWHSSRFRELKGARRRGYGLRESQVSQRPSHATGAARDSVEKHAFLSGLIYHFSV
jgi:hypothetical protein